MINSNRHPAIAEKLGLAGLFLFAATGLENFSLALTGYFLMAITACVCFVGGPGRTAKSRPELWAAVFFVYIIIRAGLAYFASPENLYQIAEWAGYYLAVSGFPALAVALWLNGNRTRIGGVLLTALAALMVTILMHSGAEDLADYLDGERAFFGLGNAAGLYIATAILGIVIFAMSWSSASHDSIQWQHFSLLAFSAVALLILSLAMVWHQNRTAFFLSLTVVPLVVLTFGIASASGPKNLRKPQYLILVMALLLFIGTAIIGTSNTGTSSMYQRLKNGYENALQAVDSDIAALQKSPLSQRLRLWQNGLSSFSENPVFGSGPGSVSGLVNHDERIAQYSHLHNLYLQLLVELGIVGFMLFSIMVLALFRSVLAAYRSHQMRPDMFYFISGSLLLFLLTNFTQVRIDGDHSVFYVTLLLALSMTHAVRR